MQTKKKGSQRARRVIPNQLHIDSTDFSLSVRSAKFARKQALNFIVIIWEELVSEGSSAGREGSEAGWGLVLRGQWH